MKSLFSFRHSLLFLLFFAGLFSLQAKPVEVWIMPNGANPQGILESLLGDFTKETGIRTNVVVLDWGEAWSRIHNALENGEGPEVLQLGTTWVPYYSAKGWLTPLNNKGVDFSRFVETSLNTAKISGQDTYYTVPWFMDVRILMGNKALLDGAGIQKDSLKTFQGFVKALREIREKGFSTPQGIPVAAYGFPGKSDWNIPHNFAPWVWSEGGSFVNVSESGTQLNSNLLDPATIRGIRKYIGFVLDTLSSRESLKGNTANVAQSFNNGELAFIITTSEVIMQTRIGQADGGLSESPLGQAGIYTFPIPEGPEGSRTFIGGSNLAIPVNHSNDPRARKLLEFLTRPSSLDEYTSRIGFLPPDRKVLTKWGEDSLYAPVVQAARTGRSYPAVPVWGEIEGMLVEMFSAIWSLVDDSGYYSEEELLSILKKYDASINDKLNVPSSQDSISLSEFLQIVNHVKTELAPVQFAPADSLVTAAGSESNRTLFVVLALAGLLLLFGLVKKTLGKK